MQTVVAPEAGTDPAHDQPPPKQRADLRPYTNENTLFVIMAVISTLFWVLLTLGTVGMIWLFMLFAYVLGIVAFSYFISYVRGNGVLVNAEQFPDLHARFEACCHTIGMHKRPEFYLLTGNGALNAFATRFLHRYYVVLYTDIVDALDDDPEALNFYIGHELGHIAQKHLIHHWWLVFARWIPLLGAAYSRAREYTCDQYGLLCTNNTRSAARALSVLAAGSKRWKTMNTQAYIAQAAQTNGFWMSLNELTADYPWLCKRVARVQHGDKAKFPRRSIFAWLFAAIVPNTGFGLLGAAIVYLYMLMFLVPLAIASYATYAKSAKESAARIEHAGTREQLGKAYALGMVAANMVGERYKVDQALPATLAEVGYKNSDTSLVKALAYNADEAEISLQLNPPLDDKTLKLKFSLNDEKQGSWTCTVGGKVVNAAIPEGCNNATEDASEEDKSETSLFTKLLQKAMTTK